MRKVARGIACLVSLSSNLPYCRCTAGENNNLKIGRKRSRTQQSQLQGGGNTSTKDDKKMSERILRTLDSRDYEMPMKHLQLSHQQVHFNGQDTSPTITTLRDSPNDTSHTLIGVSTTVSVPSFILEYKLNSANYPGKSDFESIEDSTRFFITEQIEESLGQGGIAIAEKSFASIPENAHRSTDSVDIVFVPVFLFDSTWSSVPCEVDVDKILVTIFSGQLLVEYISSLSDLDPTNAFATTTSVVFKRSHELRLDPKEQESSNSPYFAAACAGIITLLILFFWNQSMRVRSLMKRKAKGIETETLGDEEEGTPNWSGNDNPLGTCHEVSVCDNDCSVDEESTREEHFRLPLFPCLSDLEKDTECSQSRHGSVKGRKIVKQSSIPMKRRREASKMIGDFSSVEVSDDSSFSSADDSCTYEVEVSNSSEQLSPLQKPYSTLDSIFGTAQDSKKFKYQVKSSKTCDNTSSDVESCSVAVDFYGVELCGSIEQLSSLQKGHPKLDSNFGTGQISRKSKPRKKSPKTWDEESDDYSCFTSDKSFRVDNCSSFELLSELGRGQEPKDSTDEEHCKAIKHRCSMRSGDSDSSAGDSPVKKAFSFTSGSEEGMATRYASAGDETASETRIKQNCNLSSRKCEDSVTNATSESSQTTRLHDWLINQGKHASVFGSNNNGQTKSTKQMSPLLDDSNHRYHIDAAKLGDDLEPAFSYDDTHKNRSITNKKREVRHDERTAWRTRQTTKNKQRKPAIENERKRPSRSEGAVTETRMNPNNLLHELRQHLTTRCFEQKDTTRALPKTTPKTSVGSNDLFQELKQELCRRQFTKRNTVTAPKERLQEWGRPNDFIYELKERLALGQGNLRPIPRGEDRYVRRVSGDLIHELKGVLANREKRLLKYDFSAAESKNLSRVYPEGQLIIELKQKLARHHRKVPDPRESKNCTEADVQVHSFFVKDDQESIKEGRCEQNSISRDSKSTETTETGDQMDQDGNMSTVSELGEHSAVFTNPSPCRDPHVEHRGNEGPELPLVVTTRKAMRKDRTTDKDADKRKEDHFIELSHLNQILEIQSDNESTGTPKAANEAIQSTSDLEDELQKDSKYPWKAVCGETEAPTTRKNQILVVDFVAPGITATDRGSADMDLLSRYKEDIFKEKTKRQSIDISFKGDESISSIASYKARLFPKKKKNPDNIPWWVPEETDSNTSSSSTVKQDGTIFESGDDSSTSDDETSNGSSSYAATNSTRSSFFADILKQR